MIFLRTTYSEKTAACIVNSLTYKSKGFHETGAKKTEGWKPSVFST